MSKGSRIPRSPRRCTSSWAPSSRACTGPGSSCSGAWPTTCECAPRETLMITKQRPYILEPKTQAFVDALSAQGIKPIHELSYGEARQVLEDVQARTTALAAEIGDTVRPVAPTRERYARNCRPTATQGSL